MVQRDDHDACVDMEHVSVAREGKIVLHDLSLRIAAGEHVAILGPNGCGKSTLIRTLTADLYPVVQPGMRLHVFGRDRWDVTELRRRLGFVASDPPPASALRCTGREAVLTGFFSSSRLWPNLHVTDHMRQRAAEVLQQVDATSLAEQRLGSMSAGQQKRILIARALAGGAAAPESRMLLLDEPMNALDLAAQRDLRHTMRRLAASGTGILLITHRLEDIFPEMRRVVLMREGRIVADGAKEDLLTGERLSHLFGAPVMVSVRDGFFHAW